MVELDQAQVSASARTHKIRSKTTLSRPDASTKICSGDMNLPTRSPTSFRFVQDDDYGEKQALQIVAQNPQPESEDGAVS